MRENKWRAEFEEVGGNLAQWLVSVETQSQCFGWIDGWMKNGWINKGWMKWLDRGWWWMDRWVDEQVDDEQMDSLYKYTGNSETFGHMLSQPSCFFGGIQFLCWNFCLVSSSPLKGTTSHKMKTNMISPHQKICLYKAGCTMWWWGWGMHRGMEGTFSLEFICKKKHINQHFGTLSSDEVKCMVTDTYQ